MLSTDFLRSAICIIIECNFAEKLSTLAKLPVACSVSVRLRCKSDAGIQNCCLLKSRRCLSFFAKCASTISLRAVELPENAQECYRDLLDFRVRFRVNNLNRSWL